MCTPVAPEMLRQEATQGSSEWLDKHDPAKQQEEIEMAPMQQNHVLWQEHEQLSGEILETRRPWS